MWDSLTYYFQTTTSHIYVHWDSFVDVEELGNVHHGTGIESYSIAIGTNFRRLNSNWILNFRHILHLGVLGPEIGYIN